MSSFFGRQYGIFYANEFLGKFRIRSAAKFYWGCFSSDSSPT
ncbi:MAG TPA: hypothetical protein VJ873_01065 [bacterium]|nr:hypothetical protein [bacterium]